MFALPPTLRLALLPLLPAAVPTIYRASLGQRRPFHSAASAQAYDCGYLLHPQDLPDGTECGSPMWIGWMDAEDARAARDELRAEHVAAADDVGEYAATHLREIGVHL